MDKQPLDDWQKAGLAKLRAPFPAHQISKLPKPTKAQTDALKQDFQKGIRCKLCGAWHHPAVVHLDYVGHAALTDRLLDVDPQWSWEPLALDENGLPRLDESGGLWIRLTVCGITRLGYGHADQKQNADAGARLKEVIGDGLRNSAIRFGAALDLWHKGDLHGPEISNDDDNGQDEEENAERQIMLDALTKAANLGTEALQAAFSALQKSETKSRVWVENQKALKEAAEKADSLKSAIEKPASEATAQEAAP